MPDPSPHFPDTHWSLIVHAREGTETEAAAALDQLCRAYWTPLYAFARKWGIHQDTAPDVVQEFLSRFIDRGDLVRSNPERGRFRSYMLKSFQNFLVSAQRRGTAEKRGGKITFLALEDTMHEERWQAPPGSAEQAFDRRWAEETMARAMARVAADYARAGQEPLFLAMRPSLMGEAMEDMATLGGRFGLTAGAAASAVFRLKGKIREALRYEVGRTVVSESELDPEIRYLLTLLAQ